MTMLSIVVPVFNCEDYLNDCIQSILNQSYRDFELILVNDGSTDNSLNVCEKCYNEDKRIKIINQQNVGVSCARNRGIDVAQGDYIIFVDADDYIKENFFEKLMSCALKNNSELVISGFSVACGKVSNDTDILMKNAGLIGNLNLLGLMITMRKDRVRENIWRCLFSKSLLQNHNIKFKENMKIAEDFLFFLQAANSAKNVYVLPEELYVYRVNSQSVTAKFIISLHDDMVCVDDWISENVCRNHPELLNGYQERLINTYLRSIQNLCLPKTPYSLAERVKIALNYSKNNDYKIALKNTVADKNKFSKVDCLSIKILKKHLVRSYVILYSIYKKFKKM